METSKQRASAPLTRDPNGTGPNVQGMLVTKYEGKDTSQLCVYRIPVGQESDFYLFLSNNEKYTELLANLEKPGFVKLEKQAAVLKEAADDYAASRKLRNLSPSRVGWETVPMEEGCVVLWVGAHKVTKCRKPHDCRVVRYVRLLDNPPSEPLPANLKEEPNGPGCKVQGKRLFDATEIHLKLKCGKELGYGYNLETIPEEYQGYFTQQVEHPYNPKQQKDESDTSMSQTADKTEVQKHLEEFGWAVLPKVLNEVSLFVFNTYACIALTASFGVSGRIEGSNQCHCARNSYISPGRSP